jgi:hypothetical protein
LPARMSFSICRRYARLVSRARLVGHDRVGAVAFD